MNRGNVLLIDDEEKLRHLLNRIISMEGFLVFEADTLKTGLRILERELIQVILCDVKLPDGNGVEFIEKVKAKFPQVEIIMLTAYGNIQAGVQSIKNGAFDYLTKGDDNEKIIPLLYRAIEKAQLQKRVKELEKKVGLKFSFDSITGKSKAILQAIDLAKKVAQTDTTV